MGRQMGMLTGAPPEQQATCFNINDITSSLGGPRQRWGFAEQAPLIGRKLSPFSPSAVIGYRHMQQNIHILLSLLNWPWVHWWLHDKQCISCQSVSGRDFSGCYSKTNTAFLHPPSHLSLHIYFSWVSYYLPFIYCKCNVVMQCQGMSKWVLYEFCDWGGFGLKTESHESKKTKKKN